MGQIVRKKRKGRPSNSDLARRNSSAAPPSPVASSREPRRSRRPRNVRYNFEIDDYVDDDEFYDEDVRRREKKLRVLLDEDDSNRRVGHAPASSSSEDYDEDDEIKPLKKRKIDGDDSEVDEEDDDDNEIEEMEGRKVEEDDEYEAGGADSVPGTPSDLPKEVPLPDKRTLELILDKLQKKDIYGVYAEPVDPDELPDYHDVIKNPMDFATVRKKLAKETYLTLEQFESDVLLICSNAMQYNAPDTIYYKQASSIQELAKRKFQRLRANVDRSEIELKSGQKTMPSFSMPKKQSKKSVVQTAQEPVGSDFSSGPTRATTGEFQNGSSAQATSVRPGSVDGLTVENSSLMDQDKEDFQPGKGFVSRPGRKPFVHDENRRATFNISIQPITESESIFSTFEGESKQFIPVGLHADHSYARSLARFAATLGSVAWKVASQRIEQALPEGFKFGRGWVGEYEPLPTPVLVLGNRTLEDTDFHSRFLNSADVRSDENASRNTALGNDKASRNLVSGNEKASANSVHCEEPDDSGRNLQKSPVFRNTTSGTSIRIPAKQESPRGATSEMRPPFSSSSRDKPYEFASPKHQQQNSTSRNFIKLEKKGSPQVDQNYPPPTRKCEADSVAARQISNASDIQSPRPAEVVSRNRNILPSASFKQPNSNNDGFASGGQSNRNLSSSTSFKQPISNNDGFASGGQSNRNLLSSASFKQPNGNNDGFASGGQNNRNLVSSASFKQATSNNDGFASGGQSNRNLLSSASFKQPSSNNDGFASGGQSNRQLLSSTSFKQPKSNNEGFASGGQGNGKPTSVGLDCNTISTSYSSISPAGKNFPQRQEQGLSDPVQMMRMLAEKAQHQQVSSNGSPVVPKRDDSNDVALISPQFALKAQNQQIYSNGSQVVPKRGTSNNAAGAWMSLGGTGGFIRPQLADNTVQNKPHISMESIYNPARERQPPQASQYRGEFPVPGIHFQPDKNSYPQSIHAFVPPQPVRMTNEAQFQNRPVVMPQLVTADLSRFQVQSGWRGVAPQMQQQPRPKQQESRPPDLNIGYQSVGSPVRQSSGMLIDSQQPDLALQL